MKNTKNQPVNFIVDGYSVNMTEKRTGDTKRQTSLYVSMTIRNGSCLPGNDDVKLFVGDYNPSTRELTYRNEKNELIVMKKTSPSFAQYFLKKVAKDNYNAFVNGKLLRPQVF